MRFGSERVGILLSVFAAFALFVVGCGGTDTKGTPAKDKQAQQDKGKPVEVAKKDEKKGDHSGWWCDEHGIPELECSMCQEKVAKECKAKGDWCKKHDRADSQCFICHPELEKKFAALYVAKYGKNPPVPEENRAKPEDKKDGKK